MIPQLVCTRRTDCSQWHPAGVECKVTLRGLCKARNLLIAANLQVDGVRETRKFRFWVSMNLQINMISTINADAGIAECRVMNVATKAGGGNVATAMTTAINNPLNQVC